MKKESYKRGWHHTVKRGKETTITCSFCGRQVPKYKTFVVYKGFKINDPLLKTSKRGLLSSVKMYACPSCARFHRIVRKK
jgi:small subunit ribosomal protein S26e